jgi:hypothetical protein
MPLDELLKLYSQNNSAKNEPSQEDEEEAVRLTMQLMFLLNNFILLFSSRIVL